MFDKDPAILTCQNHQQPNAMLRRSEVKVKINDPKAQD
jgi:hypothetical protein